MQVTINEHVAIQKKLGEKTSDVQYTEQMKIVRCKTTVIADSLLPILSVIPAELVSQIKYNYPVRSRMESKKFLNCC